MRSRRPAETRKRACLLALVACCALAAASCGGAPGDADQARAPQTVPAPPAGEPRDPRELPAGVPLRASGAADPARAKVIRAWSAALRAGDIEAADALWATPAKVQNGTPVLTLEDRTAIDVFNGSLPCG